MTRITLALPDQRKTIMVADEKTIKEILDENSVNYSRASLLVDGMMVTSPDTLRKSLTEIGATGDCTIAVCVKIDNATH